MINGILILSGASSFGVNCGWDKLVVPLADAKPVTE